MAGFFGKINWEAGKKRGIDLTKSNALGEVEEVTEVEVKKTKITHIDNGVIVGEEVVTKTKKELLVIPRVIDEDWRIKNLRKKEEEGTLTDEEKAKLALLLESTGESSESNVQKIEATDTEHPEDPDYDQVNIDDFGMAILRGYGFKEDEGIGKTNKRVVKMPNERRRKHLGVGASIDDRKDDKNRKNDNDEEKQLKVGAKIRIEKGKYEGKYGTIEGLDPETSTCIIRLAIPGKEKGNIKISEYTVTVVSRKEYDKKAKYLTNVN